jgi:hypothetical protein
MYIVPQPGDRVQEIGYDPKRGILLETRWSSDGISTDARVLWDGEDDSRIIDYDYIEMEHPA